MRRGITSADGRAKPGLRSRFAPGTAGTAKHGKTAFILTLIALFVLMGCEKSFFPVGSEITAFEIIRVLGIDKSGDTDGVEVTVVAERAIPSPGEEGGGMAYEVMSESAPTAFEAVSKLRERSDKKQVFGYVDYIIFGEAAALDDLAKYSDYPARSPEIRYSPKVFIARGGSVRELMSESSSGDKYIGEILDNLSTGAKQRGDYGLVRHIELMNSLERRDVAAVIPAVEAVSSDEELIGGEPPDKKLSAAGYAIIRDSRLAGFFDGDGARGYNFLTDDSRSCSYSVPDGDGGFAALDVLSGGVRLAPRFDGETLTGLTCTVSVSAGIAEQRYHEKIQTEEGLRRIEAELAGAVEKEMKKAVEKSKELGLDCFDFSGRLKMRHPYKWRGVESGWREIYKNLSVEVKVDAAVRRVYDLREPLEPLKNMPAAGRTGG